MVSGLHRDETVCNYCTWRSTVSASRIVQSRLE